MMINQFAAEYTLSLGIRERYNKAKAASDEAAMQEARNAHKEQEARILEMGQPACGIYRAYCEAQERGNEYLDWNDVLWDKDVSGVVESLRRCGIEKFVFTSGWLSAVETAWQLQENGCKLESLVEINGKFKCFDSDEYEKIHGYLFRL